MRCSVILLLCLTCACAGYRAKTLAGHEGSQRAHIAVDSLSAHQGSNGRVELAPKPIKVLAANLLALRSKVAGFQVPHTMGPGRIRTFGNHAALGHARQPVGVSTLRGNALKPLAEHLRSVLPNPTFTLKTKVQGIYSIEDIVQQPDWQADCISSGARAVVYAVPGGALKHASAARAGAKWGSVRNDMVREWEVLKHLRDKGHHPLVTSGLDAKWDDDNFYILMNRMPVAEAVWPRPRAAMLHEAFTFLETMNWLYTNRVVTHDKAKGNFLQQPNFAGRAWIDMDSDIAPSEPPDSWQLEQEGEKTFGECPKHKSSLDVCFQTAFRMHFSDYFGEHLDEKLRVGRGVFNWGTRPTFDGGIRPSQSPNYLYKTDDELAQAYEILRAAFHQLPEEERSTEWKTIFESPVLDDWTKASNRIFPRDHFWKMVERLRGGSEIESDNYEA